MSYARTQKLVALSSAESEYYAMTGGISEALHLRDILHLCGQRCKIVVRTDSSAAKQLALRLGCGRSRHMSSRVLWVQQLVAAHAIEIRTIAGTWNLSDLFTKTLSLKRRQFLMGMLGFVDGVVPIGEEQFAIEMNDKAGQPSGCTPYRKNRPSAVFR